MKAPTRRSLLAACAALAGTGVLLPSSALRSPDWLGAVPLAGVGFAWLSLALVAGVLASRHPTAPAAPPDDGPVARFESRQKGPWVVQWAHDDAGRVVFFRRLPPDRAIAEAGVLFDQARRAIVARRAAPTN